MDMEGVEGRRGRERENYMETYNTKCKIGYGNLLYVLGNSNRDSKTIYRGYQEGYHQHHLGNPQKTGRVYQLTWYGCRMKN